ncbi:hypothetical protein WOA01_00125 [Methylocystis sp. IM2]|uniref:hypothetical protein n=1 Tax=unclassified Methylocystis TaxID=2625913 RepID=UPI0030F86E19
MPEEAISQLIDEIMKEMDRVWGEEGFEGTFEEYEWLLKNYGISEDEDVEWQMILQESVDDLPEEDANDPDVMEFLEDRQKVHESLKNILTKYRSFTDVFPRA